MYMIVLGPVGLHILGAIKAFFKDFARKLGNIYGHRSRDKYDPVLKVPMLSLLIDVSSRVHWV